MLRFEDIWPNTLTYSIKFPFLWKSNAFIYNLKFPGKERERERERKREREREGIDTSSLWYINKIPIPCKPRKEDIGLQPKGSLHYTKQEKKWYKTTIQMYLIMTYLAIMCLV